MLILNVIIEMTAKVPSTTGYHGGQAVVFHVVVVQLVLVGEHIWRQGFFLNYNGRNHQVFGASFPAQDFVGIYGEGLLVRRQTHARTYQAIVTGVGHFQGELLPLLSEYMIHEEPICLKLQS